MMGWWGFAGTAHMISVRDGSIVFDPTLPEYKEMLKFFQQLNSERLLDAEIFTIASPAYLARVHDTENPTVGFFADWGLQYIAREAEGSNYEFELVPPLRARPDIQPQWHARTQPIQSNLAFMVTDRPDPETRKVIMAFADLFYDPIISIRNFHGDIGHNIYHVEGRYFNFIHGGNLPSLEYEVNTLPNGIRISHSLKQQGCPGS